MRFFFECSPVKPAYRLLFVAALIYAYLWRGTSGAQVAHSVRAKNVLIVLLRKQFWKLSLAHIVFIDKTVSINVKQFHIFMMWLLFEMCG